MDLKTAEIMINKVASYAKDRNIHFVWHGGEPLLSGMDFFYGIAKIVKGIKNVKIENHIQTNASLVNDEFVKFCKENNFSVSTSIDGPEEVHNAKGNIYDADYYCGGRKILFKHIVERLKEEV